MLNCIYFRRSGAQTRVLPSDGFRARGISSLPVHPLAIPPSSMDGPSPTMTQTAQKITQENAVTKPEEAWGGVCVGGGFDCSGSEGQWMEGATRMYRND